MTDTKSSEADRAAMLQAAEAHYQRHKDRPATPARGSGGMRRLGGGGGLDLVESKCLNEGCEEMVTHLRSGRGRICDTCQEARAREEQARVEAAEQRRQAERLQDLRDRLPYFLGRAGAPARYQGFSRASWESKFKPWAESTLTSMHDERLTIAEVRDIWIEQEDRGRDWLLVLFGKHGRRKTGLGTSILGEAIVEDLPGMWIDAESWIDRLEYGLREPSFHDPNWRPWAEVFQRTVTAPYLVIDDLAVVRAGRSGSRESQDWWKERLAQLLRAREMEMLPTIVTANMSELAELGHINHSLPSRLTVRLAFKIGGSDFRRDNRRAT